MACNRKNKVIIRYLDTYPHELKPALEGDVGIDIYASEDVTIGAFETKLVPTGLYVDIPKGYEIQVRPKSGLSARGIKVDFGTIDSGYTGEIKVSTFNMSRDSISGFVTNLLNNEITKFGQTIIIKKGQKIAQLIISKVEPVEFISVKELSDTERGTNGFGSTGV